ncbi:MAG TPA: fumarylacetoacetate hydrolase family protein [Candidatus Acidoferrales bacterium]|nr:fumarylacetoacetate hydrolase family protein [Candidatus Acidoferrales bacterium]
MRICRFQSKTASVASDRQNASAKDFDAARYGIIEDDRVVELLDPFRSRERTGQSWQLSEVKLLAPCAPNKIVCVGRNYAEHAAELGNAIPEEPLIFLKPLSAIIAPEEPIVLTPHSERVDYEGELAVVIGKQCRRLGAADDVQPHILGYTCLNDVTARDLQKKDVQFTRAKGFDTFCPFGPWIETELDLNHARVETFVNKERRQSAKFTEMIFPVEFLVRWISQMMTLEAGDIIATGTPAGIGPLSAGNIVEITVTGIGTLRNPVVKPA